MNGQKEQRKWMRPLLGVGLILAGLLALNGLASWLPLRLDVTQEKLYTLSDGTHAILDGLDKPVTFTFYHSLGDERVPVALKQYGQRVKDLLQSYRRASGGKLALKVVEVKPDSEQEEQALRDGLTAIPMPGGESLFLGLAVEQGPNKTAIGVFDPNREQNLEYELSQTLVRVRQPELPTVGVLGSIPGGGGPRFVPGRGSAPSWVVFQELERSYDLIYLGADTVEIPDGVSLLMVVHPPGLSPAALYAVDQFVLRGGRVMAFLDGYSRMEEQPMGQSRESRLDPLLAAWGVSQGQGKLVADQELATNVNTGQMAVAYPLWLTLGNEQMAATSPVTAQLERVVLVDTSYFEPLNREGVSFTPLLSSSAHPGLVDGHLAPILPPMQVGASAEPQSKPLVLAALVEGRFQTAFPTPPALPKGKTRSHPHLAAAQGAGLVLLVGDSDLMADPYSVQLASNLGGQRLYKPVNDNLAFVLNGVEFLSGSQELIRVRSRGVATRPFTTVVALQRQAQLAYQQQESQLRQRLMEVRQALSELQIQKGQTLSQVPPELAGKLAAYQEEEAQTRLELRNVRKVLRQDIELLENLLLLFNLLLMPLAVAGLGVWIYLRRGGKRR